MKNPNISLLKLGMGLGLGYKIQQQETYNGIKLLVFYTPWKGLLVQ